MSKRKDDRPHGRFGRSGHTTHHVADDRPTGGAHVDPAPTRQLPVADVRAPNGTRAYPPAPHDEVSGRGEAQGRDGVHGRDGVSGRDDWYRDGDPRDVPYRDTDSRDAPYRDDDPRDAPYRDNSFRDPNDRGPEYQEPDYREPDHRDAGYREPDYRPSDYRPSDYRPSNYREPDRRDLGYRDDRDPGYRDPDRRDREYRGERDRDPHFRGAGSRDPEHRDAPYRERAYRNSDRRERGYRPSDHGDRSYPDRDRHDPGFRDDPGYRTDPGFRDDPGYRDDRGYRDAAPSHDPYPPAPGAPGDEPFGSSTYHAGTPIPAGESPTVGKAALQLGKATVTGTNKAARVVTRKVITLSEADGAKESGLTALIWNQVLSYGTDAMITVALAGTVFFGASANAQRGNVLLYLLVTMAPFALVAPVIGPALDRLQHGRRWTMAGTAIGRAALALVMAMHPTDLLVLYPCALGSLVLSKAYGVLRAAAAPRLVPPGMTLTAANAKLTIFGLVSTIVLGSSVGVIIKVTGSYSAGLLFTAVGFAACAVFAFRLPKQVDSAQPAPRHPDEPVRPRRQEKVPPLARIREWARRGFGAHLVIALQGQCLLRLLSGMLTIYLAFYVESTKHGLGAALELGAVVGAAGVGNFVGTAIGTRLRMARPDALIVICTVIALGTLIVAAVTFSIVTAVVAMLVCSALNALSKIALDSLIQNDVIETLRSSAFGKSETFLQLAWVIGAALAVALPSSDSGDGTVAFVVAAVITAAVSLLVVLRSRADRRPAHTPQPAGYPGVPRSVD